VSDPADPPLRRRKTQPSAPPLPDLDAVSDAMADLPPAPPVPRIAPLIEAPSDDVAAVPAASGVPGAVRDGYHHLPTAPVVTATSGPVDGETVEWEPNPTPAPRAVVGPWALALAVIALASSVFVGWMLPVALAAVITALVALRRPAESRGVAVWSLVLGVVATLYSAGWLVWAIPQLSLT
jgi:hypothetical protein